MTAIDSLAAEEARLKRAGGSSGRSEGQGRFDAMEAVEFSIFYDLGEGSEPWQITSVRELEDAKATLQEFAQKVPGRYFIWDTRNGTVIAHMNTTAI